VFVLSAALVTDETRDLPQSTARAVSVSPRGSPSARLDRMEEACKLIKQERTTRVATRANGASPPSASRLALEVFNGLGGFAAHGYEYVTLLGESQSTPAPWINVIATPSLGFQVSTSGSGLHLLNQQPAKST
jgi:cyclic beta-1,2-glucan synthetase